MKNTRKEDTHCNYFMGYSFQLAAKDLLQTPFNRQDSTYDGFCYTSWGALVGERTIGLPWGIMWPISPQVDVLPCSYVVLYPPKNPSNNKKNSKKSQTFPENYHFQVVQDMHPQFSYSAMVGHILIWGMFSLKCLGSMQIIGGKIYQNRKQPSDSQTVKNDNIDIQLYPSV